MHHELNTWLVLEIIPHFSRAPPHLRCKCLFYALKFASLDPPVTMQIGPLLATVDSYPLQTCYGVRGFRIAIGHS